MYKVKNRSAKADWKKPERSLFKMLNTVYYLTMAYIQYDLKQFVPDISVISGFLAFLCRRGLIFHSNHQRVYIKCKG